LLTKLENLIIKAIKAKYYSKKAEEIVAIDQSALTRLGVQVGRILSIVYAVK